jgi:uncharacterized protein
MIGTLINVIAVLLGGSIGLFLGNKIPEKTRQTVMVGLGLTVIVVGLNMALKSQNSLIMLGSVLVGGIVGEALKIEDRLNELGRKLESRFYKNKNGDHSSEFVRGFVTASLVFCVGPMAILGSINDGLLGDYNVLAIKSVLDGFAAMAFAASMGVGVLLSSVSLLLYQGGISLLAMLISNQLQGVTAEHPAILEMSGAGGVIVLGIGLLLLNLKEVRIGNFLPAIFIAPALVLLLQAFGLM